MLYAYQTHDGALQQMVRGSDPAMAIWTDLLSPLPEQRDAITALGIPVPTFEDMQEIEASNRIWRGHGVESFTVTLPGSLADGTHVVAPVTFLLADARLVTVRYHTPRPFQTFPTRAGTSASGCGSAAHLFLGLMEEVIARLADLLEEQDSALTNASQALFSGQPIETRTLDAHLRDLGKQGMTIGNSQLALFSVERALIAFGVGREDHALFGTLKARIGDVRALLSHGDFLTTRAGQLTDVALGLVNLEQTKTGRIVSVVATLFLPPTLVASIYGMNFDRLPGLHTPWGYLVATGLMVLCVLVGIVYFKWKRWL